MPAPTYADRADITCEHCIETIRKTVDAQDGARFIAGDPEAKRFSIEVERGAVLDAVAEALRSEDYPLGDASAASVGVSAAPWMRPGGRPTA